MANQKMQWQQICNIIKQQSKWLDKDFRIVAVTNGGKIPAAMYSYYSKAPYYSEVNPKFLEDAQEFPDDVVFCDEFLDSGATFRKLLAKYPRAKFFFVYCREKTWASLTNEEKKHIPVKPQGIRTDNWLVFPWEE